MKKILNRFSVWLYLKTKKQESVPDMTFRGMKVIISQYIPENTILFGPKNYKDMADVMLDQEITRK